MSGGNLSVCCVPNVCSSVGNLPFSHESIRDVTRDGARSETAPLGDHSKGRSSGGITHYAHKWCNFDARLRAKCYKTHRLQHNPQCFQVFSKWIFVSVIFFLWNVSEHERGQHRAPETWNYFQHERLVCNQKAIGIKKRTERCTIETWSTIINYSVSCVRIPIGLFLTWYLEANGNQAVFSFGEWMKLN